MQEIVGGSPVKCFNRIGGEKEGGFSQRGPTEFRFFFQYLVKLFTVVGRNIFYIVRIFQSTLNFEGSNSGVSQFRDRICTVEVFERKKVLVLNNCFAEGICEGIFFAAGLCAGTSIGTSASQGMAHKTLSAETDAERTVDERFEFNSCFCPYFFDLIK